MHGSKLFVGNLNNSVTKEQLIELFSEYGEVKNIKLFDGKGFGFLEMSNQAEAEKAKAKLNGVDFKERKLKVNEAQSPSKRRSKGFRKH